MATSDVPTPYTVLPNASTHTQPSVLPSLPNEAEQVPTVAFGEEALPPSLKRDAAIDLRIGLNMLGADGRKLLAEYITIKRQHMIDKMA